MRQIRVQATYDKAVAEHGFRAASRISGGPG
jgi:hypothetical protein